MNFRNVKLGNINDIHYAIRKSFLELFWKLYI